MAKPIIFISHISKEAALAEVLKKHITDDFLGMVDVFVSSDTTSIGAGRRWLDDVDKALKEAQIELILCSKDSVQRPWINFEAGGGWVRGIPVVPICHTDMKLVDLPVPLNMLQAVEASNLQGIQRLYTLIKEKLGSALPTTDYKEIIKEIKEVETIYKNDKLAHAIESGLPSMGNAFPDIKRVLNPKILCASSTLFETLGFEKDVEVIEKYFPNQVTVAHNITSNKLRHLLTEQRFDILHILSYIGKNGDLILVEDKQKPKNQQKQDFISAEGFAALIDISKTTLVVLASCNSLPLAASLNRKTNFMASMDDINVDDTYQWEDCFYGFLANGFSVEKAYTLSKSLHTLPMLLIPSNDIAFAPER